MRPIPHLSLPVHDLAASRAFYVDVLGCHPGRVQRDCLDVWFYGIQVTLQHAPDEVLTASDGRPRRHFGVTLDAATFATVVERLSARPIRWVCPPSTERARTAHEETKAMLADLSGNAIELKTYVDPQAALEIPPP